MKPDYKNWIPKGMMFSLIAGTALSLALLLVFGVFGIGVGGKLRIRVKRPHATLRAFDQFRTAEKRLIRQPHDLPFRCILFWA